MRSLGLSFAVSDAHREVRRAADIVTRLPGGRARCARCAITCSPCRRATNGADDVSGDCDCCLLALLIGVVVLSGGERQAAAPVTVGGTPQDPGYSAKKARLIQTGPDGQPVYTVDAAQVQQQPAQGTVDMQQVVLGFKDAAGDQWTARSERGQLAQNSGIVQLEGSVHVTGIVPGTAERGRHHDRALGV